MHRTHLVGVLLAGLTATVVGSADAEILRTCGPDPVANTADVLCAPPSGPCDAGTVVIGASITVKDSDCRFDLGGRALRVERTLQVPGDGGTLSGILSIENAGDVGIAKHGRLKARGDLVRRDGIVGGGRITLVSSGTIRVAGTLDVSGDPAGSMTLTANGDVVFERSAKVRGNGMSSFTDLGKKDADGGSLEVDTLAGNIDLTGRVQLRSTNYAGGGAILLEAARNITVRGRMDVSGGAFEGGAFEAYPGDDLIITRALIDARSRGGGGDGGTIWVLAGNDYPNDLVPGGRLVIDRAVLEASGSANDEGFPGEGGWIDAVAYGRVDVSDATMRANGATSPENPDGVGGDVFLEARDHGPSSQLDANLHVDGRISARGGRRGGEGGWVTFFAARDLDLQATIDVGGKDLAGLVIARAGRDLHLGRTVSAAVERPHGDGGSVLLRAGMRQVGALTVAADILATGGTTGRDGPEVRLEGCPITVADGITIDASADLGPDGVRPARLDLISGRPLQLGAGSRYLAGPSGEVAATHPPLLTPLVGPGTVFDPSPLVEVVAPATLFPNCPRCGDGPGDACAPEVRIDAVTPAAGVIDATVSVSSPVGLPLAGDVTICDGTGIEELTYTVLATACADYDPIDLTLNGTVVASLVPTLGVCSQCGHMPLITHTVPFEEIAGLLRPGANRLGIRKNGDPSTVHTQLFWAHATITANGVTERVALFDTYDDTAPFGTSHLDLVDTCYLPRAFDAVDAGADAHVCAAVGTAAWSGVLPCGLDLSSIEPHRDYTLVVRATDGVVAQPSSASHAFTRSEEGTLLLNGAQCP